MSNFNWTDKDSVKWFILHSAGHEGPYSLSSLRQRVAQGTLKDKAPVWAEGLESPVPVGEVLQRSRPAPVEAPVATPKVVRVPIPSVSELDEGPPPLPVIEAPPRVPEEPPEVPLPSNKGSKETRSRLIVAVTLVSLILAALVLRQLIASQEKFEIPRVAKMDPELHKKIMRTMEFGGWGKKLFFKEFVPPDMSRIWLVTASFQACAVKARFSSVEGKLLSLTDETVEFTAEAPLAGHLVEFSKFSFLKGSKIIPGLYELDLEAQDCQWDGPVPLLANRFSRPEPKYEAQTKVILYPKGPEEYGEVMDKIARKRLEQELRTQNQEDIFWQDLQLKYDTLLAVTLQVEQLFIDVIEKDARRFKTNLRAAVGEYTSVHGRFLTDFVVSNEEYFNNLSGLRDLSLKKNYESRVRLMAKKIGLEAMKFIEAWQGAKNTRRADLEKEKKKVKEVFSSIKTEINQKILQSSEDRLN